MAAVNIGVAYAVTLAAKDQPYAAQGRFVCVDGGGKLRKVRARCYGGRAKVACGHGGGAQVLYAFYCLLPALHNARFGEYVCSAAGAFYGFGALQYVCPARLHQNHVIKAHDFHGAGDSTYVACVAGVEKDKAGVHVKLVLLVMLLVVSCRVLSQVLLCFGRNI